MTVQEVTLLSFAYFDHYNDYLCRILTKNKSIVDVMYYSNIFSTLAA